MDRRRPWRRRCAQRTAPWRAAATVDLALSLSLILSLFLSLSLAQFFSLYLSDSFSFSPFHPASFPLFPSLSLSFPLLLTRKPRVTLHSLSFPPTLLRPWFVFLPLCPAQSPPPPLSSPTGPSLPVLLPRLRRSGAVSVCLCVRACVRACVLGWWWWWWWWVVAVGDIAGRVIAGYWRGLPLQLPDECVEHRPLGRLAPRGYRWMDGSIG